MEDLIKRIEKLEVLVDNVLMQHYELMNRVLRHAEQLATEVQMVKQEQQTLLQECTTNNNMLTNLLQVSRVVDN